MTFPHTDALLDAITSAKAMNRAEGKISSVVLLHPMVLEPWLREVGVKPGELEPRGGHDPAPVVAGLRIVRDEAAGVDEVCVLSDEDYLEHERMKGEAGC